MSKNQALRLIGSLSNASAHYGAVVTGNKGGNLSVAAKKETRAAQKLLTALGHKATDAELAAILCYLGPE